MAEQLDSANLSTAVWVPVCRQDRHVTGES